MKNRPLLLLTNDDGYAAQGLLELIAMVRDMGDVVVVAPAGGRSGTSCGVSSTGTVSLSDIRREEGLLVVSCSGTPVDCVKLALEHVCPRRPDLVLSGINHGDNASISVHYSGTIGAVIEACMKGLPAVGYSLRTHSRQCDFRPYAGVVRQVASHVLRHGLPPDVCLNVNFPEVESLRGVRVARMARGAWVAEWADAHHPRGQRHYWLTGCYRNLEPDAQDTDYWALDHGYAAVTPLSLDMTAYSSMNSLASLEGGQA